MRTYDKPDQALVTMYFPRDLADRAKDAANEMGISRSEFIRRLAYDALQTEQSMNIDPRLVALRMEELTGMTAAELVALPMDEYARLRRTVLADLTPSTPEPVSTGTPAPAPTTDAGPGMQQTTDLDPQGVDIASMSYDEYAQFRQQVGIDKSQYGTGITSGANSRDAWIQAASAKSGRSAMVQRGVEESPRIDNGKYLNANTAPDGRQSFYQGR